MKKLTRALAAACLVVGLSATALAGSTVGSRLITQQVTIDRSADDRTLTIRYTGASARSVELRINGKRAETRLVNDQARSGETNFSLDLSLLEDGENAVEVRLFDASGRLLATQKSTVSVDWANASPIFLSKPVPGATIQAAVEISVGFKVPMKNVFVSFFVDNDLKAMRNYAPYAFLWDTTKVDNGWHDVQAWIVDQDTQTFKTQKIRVYVNNPSGRTERKDPLADEASGQAQLVASIPAAAPAVATAPAISAVTSASGPRRSAPPRGTTMGSRALRPKEMQPQSPVAPSVPAVPAGPAQNDFVVSATVPAPLAEAAPAVVAPAKPAVAKPSSPAKPAVATPSTPAKPAVARPSSTSKPSRARLVVSYGTRLGNARKVGVEIDGESIAFDVAPRIEGGIALTPFRRLYEHFGGKVAWNAADQTVRGTGPGGEVVVRIGSKYATIEDIKVMLERAVYLDRGRSIVPISFMSQVLGFDVQYDPRSKHILVTTARKN